MIITSRLDLDASPMNYEPLLRARPDLVHMTIIIIIMIIIIILL